MSLCPCPRAAPVHLGVRLIPALTVASIEPIPHIWLSSIIALIAPVPHILLSLHAPQAASSLVVYRARAFLHDQGCGSKSAAAESR